MAKISLAGVKKNSLWIGCGLAIVVGAVCWYVATGRLTTAYRQNKATVEGKFTAIDARIKNPENRSDHSIDGIKKDISDAYQRVKKTWEELYHRQAEVVFVWPEGLKQDFRDKIKELDDRRVKWLADKAAGKVQGDPPSDEIPERLREDYQNFVRGEFRRLLQTIDAATGEDATAGVRWRDADRIELTFNSRQTPSSTWIRLRQEDLWVYGAFCRVIQAVNKGVTGRTTLPIKIIDTLEIGEAAARSAPAQVGQKRLKRIHPGSSGESSSSTQPAPGSGSGSGNADEALKDKRYLDFKTWRPIPAGDLATASPLEFKLIPFRLLVYMDQRDIDRLLLEFRSSVLPIEVLEMRINASAGSAAFGDGRDPGSSVYHIPVEFRGVVYIYNPPSLKKPEFVKDTETAVAAVSATESPTTEAPTAETPTPEPTTPAAPAAVAPAEQPVADKPAASTQIKFIAQADGKLKIKTADDQELELELADNLQVTIDGAEAKLEDLKPDMALDIVKENEKVVAIHAKSVGSEMPTP